jgi:hypothetical protein
MGGVRKGREKKEILQIIFLFLSLEAKSGLNGFWN